MTTMPRLLNRRLVAVLALVLLAGCGSTKAADHKADAEAGAVTVPDGPVGLTADDSGAVWVASARDNAVSRIPAGASKPDLRVDVAVPLRLTAAEGAVWATSFENGTLLRIDTLGGTVTDRIPVGNGAEGLLSAFGAIWAVAQDDGRLVRVDPTTRAVSQRIVVGLGVRLVKASPDALWLNDYPNNRLVRVDPTSGRVTKSGHVCDGPQDMASYDEVIWVTCSTGNELVSVDTKTLQVSQRVPLAGTPDAIAAGPNGNLLVVLQDGPTLARVDPETGRTKARTKLGKQAQLHDQANLDLATTDGRVWVSSFLEGKVYRVG
jgi:streptogramin lyase